MNKEEQEKLLKEAKERYPIGTKFRTAYKEDKDTAIVNSNEAYWHRENSSISFRDTYCLVYYEGKWAEIIELPKDYIAPSENLLLNLQIW